MTTTSVRPALRQSAPRRATPLTRRRSLSAYLFLLPAALILLAFVFYPTFQSLYLSFTNASGFGTPQIVGVDNYVTVFSNPDSINAIKNTLVYAIGFTPTIIAVALGLAILLNRPDLPFKGLFRTLIFMPFIISMAVAALSWSFLIDARTGLVPYWLKLIGIDLPDLLNSTTWAMPTVIFVAVWKNFGYFMVIFIAGLQGISRELYEAATIDGAGPWRRFTSVTLPGLRPTMTYVVILAANFAFQAFDQIYVMTGGGPQRTTETIVYRVYVEGFTNFRQGYAASLSFVLMAITMIIGIIQLIINSRQEKDLS